MTLYTGDGASPPADHEGLEHHLLDRPRDHPTRTAFGRVFVALHLVLFFGGANDVLAERFHLSLNSITWAARIDSFAVPALTYVITRRICLGLLRQDRDKLLHGHETGRIKRLPHGEFVEMHERLDRATEYTLLSGAVHGSLPTPLPEHDGVPNPRLRKEVLRHRLSHWLYAGQVAKPAPQEMRHAIKYMGHSPEERGSDPEPH